MSEGIEKMVKGVLLGIIGLILLLNLLGVGIPEVQSAGNLVNDTGAPLSGLFASDSIVPLILVAVGLIAVVMLAFRIIKTK